MFLLIPCLGTIGALAAYTTAANLLASVPTPTAPAPREGKNLRVLLLGASGMVGGEVLRACLAHGNVAQVTAIVRRPLTLEHPKLAQTVHSDFSDFSALDLRGFDTCFYCIGAYTGTLDDAEYERVLWGIPRAFADELRRQNAGVTLCFLTGAGADETEQSRAAYARLFGKAENHLKRLGFTRLHIFRPGYIYPVTPRKEPNLFYTLMRVLYKPFFSHMKGSATTSAQLARAMLDVALSDGGKLVYENIDITQRQG
ncbi:MAG: hypothetical protein IKH84_07395 [Ottowia sp.]|nr:hypothetical protein [Ottowia sp.]